MTRHMIVEIVLLVLCTICLVSAYACCVISGKCSRMEEKGEIKLSSCPRKVNKPFRSVWVDEEYKELGGEKCQENIAQK